ncbi:MAG TPA: hypothetical protein VEC12_12850 [Bacteroidia bacterium]|nr:hypothetical protein [Bacteroidia bacterium]
MVVTDKVNSVPCTLRQLLKDNPAYIDYLLEGFELLMNQNEKLLKIAARYSHDLRSPVTNINMLLQLHEKAESPQDARIYMDKMNSSLTRLLDGFDNLSVERKKSLLKYQNLVSVSLVKMAANVRRQLPDNINFISDFDQAPEINCHPYNMEAALVLLLSSCAGEDETCTIRLTSERSWKGTHLRIQYPTLLNIADMPLINAYLSGRNMPPTAMAFEWNYYFASLFLGAMGAVAAIEEEHTEGHSEIIISPLSI